MATALAAALFVSLLTVAAVALAVSVSPRFLWLAALASWIFSFLGSFSIGLYTLVVTFVLLALAIGFTAGWIRGPLQAGMAIAIGIATWAVAIRTIDDYWLFFPISSLGHLFS